MAYTPNLTMESSCTLRRIAWAMGLPMTEAIQKVFTKALPQIIEKKVICEGCRDKSRCETCLFNTQKNNTNPLLTIEGKELVLNDLKKKQHNKKKSA